MTAPVGESGPEQYTFRTSGSVLGMNTTAALFRNEDTMPIQTPPTLPTFGTFERIAKAFLLGAVAAFLLLCLIVNIVKIVLIFV